MAITVFLHTTEARRAGWPKNPRSLAGRLRRAQTFLRALGIEITFSRDGRAGTRLIRIGACGSATIGRRRTHAGRTPVRRRIWVLDPALAQHLVGEVLGVLEDCQPAISRVSKGGLPSLAASLPTSAMRQACLCCSLRRADFTLARLPVSAAPAMQPKELLTAWALVRARLL